jgi:eukaryotic-like serine/threonine-protein kinase
MEAGDKGRLRFDEFEFDSSSAKLFHEGRPVKIEPQPLRVLGVLLERPGEIVSREQLRARVWGDTTFVEFDQSLNYCIRKIRLALRDEASEPVYIETLPRQGYRFIGSLDANEHPIGFSPEMLFESSGTQPSAAESALPPKQTWWGMGVVAIGVALAAAIVWALLRDHTVVPIAALNASLLPPPATSFLFNRNGEGGFAISPDGAMLAFVGDTQGKSQLWVRRLDQSESRLVPGSEGAYKPFWSPDSRWIAFFTPLKLKKSEVANGATIDLCDVPPITSHGSWSARGVILWGNANGTMPIQRLPDVGGPPIPVPGTTGAVEPHFLPDGQRFVYRADYWSQELWLASLDPQERPRRIGEVGMYPTYSAGHLLWVSNGILIARSFDVARGEFTGQPFRLNAPLAVRVHLGLLLADFSANAAGMLVYPPQTNSLVELRWRDRKGKLLGSLGASGEYYTPRISPDGQRVAFARRDSNNSESG